MIIKLRTSVAPRRHEPFGGRGEGRRAHKGGTVVGVATTKGSTLLTVGVVSDNARRPSDKTTGTPRTPPKSSVFTHLCIANRWQEHIGAVVLHALTPGTWLQVSSAYFWAINFRVIHFFGKTCFGWNMFVIQICAQDNTILPSAKKEIFFSYESIFFLLQ